MTDKDGIIYYRCILYKDSPIHGKLGCHNFINCPSLGNIFLASRCYGGIIKLSWTENIILYNEIINSKILIEIEESEKYANK